MQDTALAVMDCRETATSREDFIDQMKARGYGVDWQDSHKYITFTDLERQSQGEKQCKVRNNKLEKYYAVDFGKESLEHDTLTSAYSAVKSDLEAAQAELQILKQEVIKSSKNPFGAGRKPKLTVEQVEQVKMLSAEGLSVRKIAAKMDCSAALICKLLKDDLEQPRPTGRTRIPLQPSGFLTLGCIGTAI